MKFTIALIFALLLVKLPAFCQKQNDITGKWINSPGTEKIEIYEKEGKYFGRLIWLKDSPTEKEKQLKDSNNPKQELKDKDLIGIEVIRDLDKRRDDLYRGGIFYDFHTGRSLNTQISVKDETHIAIRNYFGLPIMGKTVSWTREE